MAPEQQYVALVVLEMLQDLFAASEREAMGPLEVWELLETEKHNPELIDAEVLAAYERTMFDLMAAEKAEG